eukprot:5900705-Pyramimonas_sp.AAC.1
MSPTDVSPIALSPIHRSVKNITLRGASNCRPSGGKALPIGLARAVALLLMEMLQANRAHRVSNRI